MVLLIVEIPTTGRHALATAIILDQGRKEGVLKVMLGAIASMDGTMDCNRSMEIDYK
jgi:hypothetical protein